ncbi:phospholipase A2 inhibitor and Ly6/PLAUR domain-containing protein-like [Mixophyes fleayi]|uniref:phospholipase A2 inhibitor and Ly6/PLAUR domain-containing protein-like n=1 Tax=Mixophyes fleayi TaxID=3061075 RepID=UPI003F4E18EF
MIEFLHTFTLFCAFLTTGNSLSCLKCNITNGAFCHGYPHPCSPQATSCIKTLELTTTGDEMYRTFTRDCNEKEDVCNLDYMMYSGRGNKQSRIITHCCNTDNCNNCRMRVPPYNETLNNLLCPVCYKRDSYDCTSKGYIACRGEEKECIDFAATLSKKGIPASKSSLMGCSTPGICSLGPNIVPATELTDKKRFSCFKAYPITH